MYRAFRAVLVGLLAMAAPTYACGFSELTEAELDRITAGAAAVARDDDILRFQFRNAGRRGHEVDGSGSLSFRGGVPGDIGALLLRDSAQSNLRSLVNINAVNSPVQVLLNLNLNVNSTVGTVRQLNLSGRLQ